MNPEVITLSSDDENDDQVIISRDEQESPASPTANWETVNLVSDDSDIDIICVHEEDFPKGAEHSIIVYTEPSDSQLVTSESNEWELDCDNDQVSIPDVIFPDFEIEDGESTEAITIVYEEDANELDPSEPGSSEASSDEKSDDLSDASSSVHEVSRDSEGEDETDFSSCEIDKTSANEVSDDSDIDIIGLDDETRKKPIPEEGEDKKSSENDEKDSKLDCDELERRAEQEQQEQEEVDSDPDYENFYVIESRYEQRIVEVYRRIPETQNTGNYADGNFQKETSYSESTFTAIGTKLKRRRQSCHNDDNDLTMTSRAIEDPAASTDPAPFDTVLQERLEHITRNRRNEEEVLVQSEYTMNAAQISTVTNPDKIADLENADEPRCPTESDEGPPAKKCKPSDSEDSFVLQNAENESTEK